MFHGITGEIRVTCRGTRVSGPNSRGRVLRLARETLTQGNVLSRLDATVLVRVIDRCDMADVWIGLPKPCVVFPYTDVAFPQRHSSPLSPFATYLS